MKKQLTLDETIERLEVLERTIRGEREVIVSNWLSPGAERFDELEGVLREYLDGLYAERARAARGGK